MDKSGYISNLNDQFCNDKYEKLESNPISEDLKELNKPYIFVKDYYKMRPKQNIKKGYGLLNPWTLKTSFEVLKSLKCLKKGELALLK